LKLLEKLKEVQDNKKALLAANFYNLETCKAIARAASETGEPVILQLTPASIEYMGLTTAFAVARTVSAEEHIQSWVHLDHCSDITLIQRCLDEGFDSVMIDASDKDIDENIAVTAKVVKMAEPYHVNVEAELGYVPKPGADLDRNKFTEPAEAKRFVDETGVTSLAVAVGSKHGFYSGRPVLDIQRIIQIKELTYALLVLHGASGIPDEQIQEAAGAGISKVNVATETKNLFMRSLKEVLLKSDDIDLRNVFPSASEVVTAMIKHKLEIVSLANKSSVSL
jgi:tagatose 1,6-diphosphate aldolase GatY/KbaY